MMDFPASPTPGQYYNPGNGSLYVWDGVAWNLSTTNIKTAEARNRFVNPATQISQENGTTLVNTSGAYPCDQFNINFSGTGKLGGQLISGTPKDGNRYRVRLTVVTADTSLTGTDFAGFLQNIEGTRFRDFLYGSADAKQAVFRFGFKGPAGTYSVRLINSAADRSYVAQFTISAAQANIDTDQVIVIPGDVSGTWAIDSTVGVAVMIVLAAGPTYVGSLGWQAGNFIAAAGQFNGLGSTGNVFEVFNFGFHRDPDKTGLPPPFEIPDIDDDLRDCQRYWEQSGNYDNMFSGDITSGQTYYGVTNWKVPKRTVPTLSGTVANQTGFAAAIGTLVATDGRASYEGRAANASGVAGMFRSIITGDARM